MMMRFRMATRIGSLVTLVVVVGLSAAACSNESTSSEESLDLEIQLEDVIAERDTLAAGVEVLQSDLAAAIEMNERLSSDLAQSAVDLAKATDEREFLVQQAEAAASRYDKSLAGQQAVTAIIANPTAHGTKQEALDLLDSYAAAGAVMDDVAFGSLPMRQAWDNTLYGFDAHIDTWISWLSDDGSNGGSLWTWVGTRSDGEPFELIGINLDDYDDDGRITYQLVAWPYNDHYVTATVTGN